MGGGAELEAATRHSSVTSSKLSGRDKVFNLATWEVTDKVGGRGCSTDDARCWSGRPEAHHDIIHRKVGVLASFATLGIRVDAIQRCAPNQCYTKLLNNY